MCGIAGLLSFDEGAAEHEVALRHSSQLMVRRGPDDDGFWRDPSCLLAVRRLSVLDPTQAAHQPMVTSDGRFALAFNGELYNFRELRHDLEADGVAFRSSGDTEVVLQALSRFGPEVLTRFDGMFALALYDARARRLLLARDHAGIKPLYLLRTDDGVLFGSQFDQILAHSWARDRGVSRDGLALYLQLGHVPAPFALLDGSAMVEPGVWLSITADGDERRGRHHTFPVYTAPNLRGEEAVDALGSAISCAVRRHMVSDAPLGALLSGGIDSPLIAAEMRQTTAGEIPAFTLATRDPAYDETEDARRYAERLKLTHHIRRVDADEAAGALGRVMDACADPLEDSSLLPSFLICEAAAPHVKVLLAGDGGDDILWGYHDRQSAVLTSLARAGARQSIATRLLAAIRGRGATASGRRRSAGADYLARQSFIAPGWLGHVLSDPPAWPAACRLFVCDSTDPDVVAQWIRWNDFTCHLPRVLLKVDRASMYHSLEVRVPFLDKGVLDVAARTDWRSCLDLQRGTGKRGFSVPMSDWLRTTFRPLVEDHLLSRDAILGEALDRDGLRAVYDRHLTGAEDSGWGLWRLLSLSLWETRHFARRGTLR